jgi:hypothetical protein
MVFVTIRRVHAFAGYTACITPLRKFFIRNEWRAYGLKQESSGGYGVR